MATVTGTPAEPDRGRLGEELAAAFLRARGLRIVSRRLRTRHGEIDLLCRRRRLYVAVEVKTRSRDPAPERAVTPEQRARIFRAVRALAPLLTPPPRQLRIDVVAVRLIEPAEVRWFQGTSFCP